jgi:hypothetical protein
MGVYGGGVAVSGLVGLAFGLNWSNSYTLIREHLFFFWILATKITTQFVLISNNKAFV